MLRRCCSHGSLSLSLLLRAKSIPSQSSRDEAFARGDANLRPLRRGALRGGSSYWRCGANLRPLRRGALCGGSSYWRCGTSARPPPPPPPNFGGDDSSRLQEEFSKIQDRVRIFFAVLFWMLLFFWSSAWDGTDDSRNKKGPRFGKKFK